MPTMGRNSACGPDLTSGRPAAIERTTTTESASTADAPIADQRATAERRDSASMARERRHNSEKLSASPERTIGTVEIADANPDAVRHSRDANRSRKTSSTSGSPWNGPVDGATA